MVTTKSKKQKVTLETINENLESFQSFVVKEFGRVNDNFDRVWVEISELKIDISEIKKDIKLIHSELSYINKRIDVLDQQLKNQSGYAKEIDDLRDQLNKIYKILEQNNLTLKK